MFPSLSLDSTPSCQDPQPREAFHCWSRFVFHGSPVQIDFCQGLPSRNDVETCSRLDSRLQVIQPLISKSLLQDHRPRTFWWPAHSAGQGDQGCDVLPGHWHCSPPANAPRSPWERNRHHCELHLPFMFSSCLVLKVIMVYSSSSGAELLLLQNLNELCGFWNFQLRIFLSSGEALIGRCSTFLFSFSSKIYLTGFLRGRW